MKKVLFVIIVLALVFSFTGCVSDVSDDILDDVSSYTIDYMDATSFEDALNDGGDVKGKVVQFYVEKYAPDSALGINCHAGEHLNFLFEDSLDVETGDTIIVRITEEPSKVFLLGSWKVPCEFLDFVYINQDNDTNKETVIESQENDTNKETIIESLENNTNKEPTTESQNMAEVPDVWMNLLEKHYKEVKKQFEDAGFTNITCFAHEIDYNENYVFEGSVINIAIGENAERCTFEKGEQWPKDTKIRIDYRVKPVKEDSSETTKPETPSQTQSNSGNSTGNSGVTVPKQEENKGNLVWVPTNGGTKYHSRSGCSGMKNSMQVSVETAKANGYTPCGKCY